MTTFPAPKSKLLVEKCAFSFDKSRHKNHVNDHYFNSAVEIFIPKCKKHLPEEILKCSPVEDNVYLVKDLPIVEFINYEFINQFVKKGKFYALSQGTCIDNGNVVAVLPTGTLVLSVDKDTYEELGLVGQPSQFNTFKKPRKFVIKIDLLSSTFYPGKKNFERVVWCLRERIDLKFDFLMCWNPHSDCSESTKSLSSYFSDHSCIKVAVSQFKHHLNDFSLPVITSDSLYSKTADDGSCHNCDYVSFYEWLGSMSCQINCSEGKPDSFISTYMCPEPHINVKHGICYKWYGMITTQRVEKLIDAVRLYLSKDDNEVCWASVTVHGFMDSPVSWNAREHGFYVSGENLYTFIIFPDDIYWLFMTVGSHDVCLS